MPKLIVNLDPEKMELILPYDHQYAMYSSILQVINRYDPTLATEIHNKYTIPQFTMSQLIPAGDRQFLPEGIKAKRFVLMIISNSDRIINTCQKSLKEYGKLSIGKMNLIYHSSRVVSVKEPPEIPELVSRSPIILKSEGKYVSFGDDEFLDALKSNILGKVKAIHNSSDYMISFIRILEGRKKAYTIHSAKVSCSIIRFIIDADRIVLQTIMNYGIGSKTQMGFGMVEVRQ
jgi:CRISPR-associated endoribonuclease Cas6